MCLHVCWRRGGNRDPEEKCKDQEGLEHEGLGGVDLSHPSPTQTASRAKAHSYGLAKEFAFYSENQEEALVGFS